MVGPEGREKLSLNHSKPQFPFRLSVAAFYSRPPEGYEFGSAIALEIVRGNPLLAAPLRKFPREGPPSPGHRCSRFQSLFGRAPGSRHLTTLGGRVLFS